MKPIAASEPATDRVPVRPDAFRQIRYVLSLPTRRDNGASDTRDKLSVVTLTSA